MVINRQRIILRARIGVEIITRLNQINQTIICVSHLVHPVHLVTRKKFVLSVLSVGKKNN